MKLSVNGEMVDVSATLLSEVLEELGLGDSKVATAVNEEFVPASARGETSLHDGDRIEIVAPRQGG